jgi:hypothetical protein
MAIRIQLRRDTAANWVSSNPVLRQGEIGIETDTLQMKLGNGTSTWTQITGYMNLVPDGNLTIGDYVMVNDIGAISGVVGLDSSKNALIPGSSIIVEGSSDNSFETTLTVTDPTADRTITFKNADGTDSSAGRNIDNTTGPFLFIKKKDLTSYKNEYQYNKKNVNELNEQIGFKAFYSSNFMKHMYFI